ncbi:hypothetical protein [Propionivibrio dicarboxylicus]|uniref:Uncharacterized protein n=1 Tax=Propionivibrio dicarboxylicus TaxID=83767 RepID=A0A1G7YB50_9RHOO|nr:hypothetical protein [Propionivibrio dicarboxylicus]SDG93587.1 hypothetical protein SAMN05660652_00948 [Propionivibrio dicarboxylicus]
MRISEYKAALAQIDIKDMDKLIAAQTGTSVHFQAATAPPERWQRVQGAIINAAGDTGTEGGSPSPGDAPPPSAILSLATFRTDLQREFGASITMECIDHHHLAGDTPITARTVKNVIDMAENRRRAMQMANDSNLSAYFDHDMWAGILPSAKTTGGSQHLHTAVPRGILGERAAQFVTTLITTMCERHPDYSRKALTLIEFIHVAQTALNLYDNVVHLSAIPPATLELTFAMAYEDLLRHGISHAVRRLPVYAATACLCHKLDPRDPGSFMHQALQTAARDPGLPPLSEMFISCAANKFTIEIKKMAACQEISENDSMATIFANQIAQGRLTLERFFEDHYELQSLIETSTVLTQRQKTMLHQSLDHGRLPPERLKLLVNLATWMGNEFAERLNSLLDPERFFVDHVVYVFNAWVETLAKTALQEVDEAMGDFLAQPQGDDSDDSLRAEMIESYCKAHAAFMAAGLSTDDAGALATLLSKESVVAFLNEHLDKLDPLYGLIYRSLMTALARRRIEVGDDIHALMLTSLDQTIRNTVVNPAGPFQLLCGLRIPKAFWEAVRDNTLILSKDNDTAFIDFYGWEESLEQLEAGNLQSFINLTDWHDLGDETKLKRLEIAYQNIVNTIFGGNADKAATFMNNIMAFLPAVLAVCATTPASDPINLGPENAVINLGTNFNQTQCIVTLMRKDNGHLPIRFEYSSHGLRSATNTRRQRHWMDVDKSQISLECLVTLSPNGRIVPQAPMKLEYLLMPDNWPIDNYPRPIPGDLYNLQYAAHDDLLHYVASSGNESQLDLILALDVIHDYRAQPSFQRAYLIYDSYIATGALDCLNDAKPAFLEIEQMLFDQLNAKPFCDVLKSVDGSLEIVFGDPHFARYENAAVALRNHISAFIDTPDPISFRRLRAYMFTRGGAYSLLRDIIPKEYQEALAGPLTEALRAPSASLVYALERKLVKYIGKEILPGFIASVRESAARTRPNT